MRKWAGYTGVVGLAAAALWARDPHPKRSSDNETLKPFGSGSVLTANVADPAVGAALASYATSTEWRDGVRRFLEQQDPSPRPWTAPPASQVRPGYASDAGSLGSAVVRCLQATLGSALPEGVHCDASLAAWGSNLPSFGVGPEPLLFQPIDPRAEKGEFHVFCQTEGFYSSGAIPLVLADLATSTNETMPVVANAAPAGAQVALTSLTWTVQVVSRTTDSRSGPDGDSTTPVRVRASATDRVLAPYEGTVSVDDLDATDHVLVTASDRFTAALVSADGPLGGAVDAWRDGDGESIGRTIAPGNILAVAVDRWSSIRLRVHVDGAHRALSYSIFALSGPEEPYVELLAWFVGSQLMSDPPDRVQSSAEARATVCALLSAFAVHVEALRDPVMGNKTSNDLMNELARIGSSCRRD